MPDPVIQQHADSDSTVARGLRIEVRRLTKTVGDGHRVLDDISFAIEPRELVAIVGGSGAGRDVEIVNAEGVVAITAGPIPGTAPVPTTC